MSTPPLPPPPIHREILHKEENPGALMAVLHIPHHQRHIQRDRWPSTAASPVCWVMESKGWNSVRWGKKYFVLGKLEQLRQDKNPFYLLDKPKEPTKEGLLSFVLFESPFTSVSTVSRSHPSLVSLFTCYSFLDGFSGAHFRPVALTSWDTCNKVRQFTRHWQRRLRRNIVGLLLGISSMCFISRYNPSPSPSPPPPPGSLGLISVTYNRLNLDWTC